MSTIDEVYTLLQELEPDDAMSTTQQLRSLLQELADRRSQPPDSGCTCLDVYHWHKADCPKPKPTTYDERDMQKRNTAILERETLFDRLKGTMVELGLLSPDASDQTAFIAIRDILHAHAQDKSYDARYGVKTAANPSKEQGRAYETPSDKV